MPELSKIRKDDVDYDIKDQTARDELEELKKKVPEEGLKDGATFTPHVDDEGNLSWSNDKELDNPETKNIKGKPGDDGITPHIGENGNWFIGDTDTGKPSQGADYALTDTDKNEMVNSVLAALPTWNGGSY